MTGGHLLFAQKYVKIRIVTITPVEMPVQPVVPTRMPKRAAQYPVKKRVSAIRTWSSVGTSVSLSKAADVNTTADITNLTKPGTMTNAMCNVTATSTRARWSASQPDAKMVRCARLSMGYEAVTLQSLPLALPRGILIISHLIERK